MKSSGSGRGFGGRGENQHEPFIGVFIIKLLIANVFRATCKFPFVMFLGAVFGSLSSDASEPVLYAISSEGIFSYRDTISFSDSDSANVPLLAWPRRIHTEMMLVDGSNDLAPITGKYSNNHRSWKSDLRDERVVRGVVSTIRDWAEAQPSDQKLAAILFPNDGQNYPRTLKNVDESRYFALEPREEALSAGRVFKRSTRYTMGYLDAYARIASELEDISNLTVIGGFYHYYNSLPLDEFHIHCQLPQNFIPMVAFYNAFDRYQALLFDETPNSYQGDLINFGPVLKGFYDCAKRPVWVFEYYWKLNWLGAVWPEYHVAFSNARSYLQSGFVSAVISQDPGESSVLTSMLNRFAPIYGLREDGAFADMLEEFCRNSDIAYDVGLVWCLDMFSRLTSTGRRMDDVNGRDREKLVTLAELNKLVEGLCDESDYQISARAEICDQVDYSTALGLAYLSKGNERCLKLKNIVSNLNQRGAYGHYELQNRVATSYIPSMLKRAKCGGAH